MNLNDVTEKIDTVSSNYAKKYNIKRDDDWLIFKLNEELGELNQKYLMMTGRARTKGFTDDEIKEQFNHEVADVLSHILLIAKHLNIDLEKTINDKWFKYL